MKEDIIELRKRLDGAATYCITRLNGQQGIRNYYTDTAKSLLMAKAWLGKLLGQHPDTPSPYKDGKTQVSDIEPTADQASSGSILPVTDNRIEAIDLLRQYIGKLADELQVLTDLPNTREAAICRTQAWVYTCEARFILGFALEYIRNTIPKANDQAI